MTTAGNDTGGTREDKLLARRYQQITAAQATRYAATYDADAGLLQRTNIKGWAAGAHLSRDGPEC